MERDKEKCGWEGCHTMKLEEPSAGIHQQYTTIRFPVQGPSSGVL